VRRTRPGYRRAWRLDPEFNAGAESWRGFLVLEASRGDLMGRSWQVQIDGIAHAVEADYEPLFNTGTGSVWVDGRLVNAWGPNWLGHPREQRFPILGHAAILRKKGWIFENYDLFVDGVRVPHQPSAVAAPELRSPLPPELERLSQLLIDAGMRIVRERKFEEFGNVMIELAGAKWDVRFGRDRDYWDIEVRRPRSEWREIGLWQRNVVRDSGPDLTDFHAQAAFVEDHLAELLGDEPRNAVPGGSMKRLAQYPTFWPGDLPFFVQERTTWTNEQTEAWAAWLQRAIEPRTDYLLEFFGIPKTLVQMERFAATAGRAAELCGSDPDAISAAHSPSEVVVRGHTLKLQPRALPSGYALALGVDLGLLKGRLLMEAHPGLVWQIIWKPRNRVDYRNPVLTWGTKGSYDPYGSGLGFASQLANRELDREKAERLYATWDQMICDGI
jgi:hypothetical protein